MDKNQLRVQGVSYDAFVAQARPDGQNFTVKFDGLYQFAMKDKPTRRKLTWLFLGFLVTILYPFQGAFPHLRAGYALGGEVGVGVALVLLLGMVTLGIYGLVLAVRLVKTRGRAELLGQGSASLEDRRKAYAASLKRNVLSSDVWP